jgi:hypothetical protein
MSESSDEARGIRERERERGTSARKLKRSRKFEARARDEERGAAKRWRKIDGR